MASYTSPTLTGYNQNPPPDDGSEQASNEVTWDTIKTKLPDPIKNYAEAIDSAATTAFTTIDGQIANWSQFVNPSDGSLSLSSTVLSLGLGLTEDTWQGVGPTGSGETNIWAALDSIPTDVDWIEVLINTTTTSGSDTVEVNVHARADGSTAAIDGTTLCHRLRSGSSGSGGTADAGGTTVAKINVASRVFDIARNSVNVSGLTIVLYLRGYGYNTP